MDTNLLLFIAICFSVLLFFMAADAFLKAVGRLLDVLVKFGYFVIICAFAAFCLSVLGFLSLG